MAIYISMQKQKIYLRRESSRSYPEPLGKADGSHVGISPMEKAYKIQLAVDPDLTDTVDRQRKVCTGT